MGWCVGGRKSSGSWEGNGPETKPCTNKTTQASHIHPLPSPIALACDVVEVLPHNLLHSVKGEAHDLGALVAGGGGEHLWVDNGSNARAAMSELEHGFPSSSAQLDTAIPVRMFSQQHNSPAVQQPTHPPQPHHEHRFPPALHVCHPRQHHLADAADDELPDLHRATVPHHHHKGAQEVVLQGGRGARGRGGEGRGQQGR